MRCSACGGPYHEATGHRFTATFRLCGRHALEFYRWYKLRMLQVQARHRHKDRKEQESFHDNALRSNK